MKLPLLLIHPTMWFLVSSGRVLGINRVKYHMDLLTCGETCTNYCNILGNLYSVLNPIQKQHTKKRLTDDSHMQ